MRPRTEADLRELADAETWESPPASVDQAELLSVAKLILLRHREGRRYLSRVTMSRLIEVWLVDVVELLWPADDGKAYHHFGDYAVAWAMQFVNPNDDAIPLT
jgi:hypothetical protein